MSSKQNFQRKKRKMPPKNRHVSIQSQDPSTSGVESASSRKLKSHNDAVEIVDRPGYFMFIDIDQMKTLLENVC